ncbi:type IV toxin-antitoxin system AbiEi family antitoxin domain-containing protein [Candidatus Micrarchaeota archaeon]|nr:type IV toxin-antitoxin system AbiEi family antitoxin domain-containing protein [Candidatus Micrarchaeota archaeon]
MKNATLSPLEQKVYFAVRNAGEGVVSLEIIRSLRLADDRTLLFVLSNMVKKGWLTRLRRGVYLVGEPGGSVVKDAFLIATYVFPGYVAFSSALYVHKLVDVMPFEVQVATRNESMVKRIGEYSFRAIPIGERHFGSERKDGRTISTVAKTIYDCLTHAELGGGYPQILKAIYEANLSKTQWKELFYYAEKFESNAFYQRLGYLLSIMPKKDKQILIAIKKCRKKTESKIYLFKRRKGKYISEWKLVDDVGREELLSWWY